MPLQQQRQQPPQQVEGGMPSQFSGKSSCWHLNIKDRFKDPRSSTSGDGNRSFSVPNDSARQFQGELRLIEPPSASSATVQAIRPSYNLSSASNSKVSNSSNNSSRSVVGVLTEKCWQLQQWPECDILIQVSSIPATVSFLKPAAIPSSNWIWRPARWGFSEDGISRWVAPKDGASG